MAFSTTIQHVEKPAPSTAETPEYDHLAQALMGMLVLSVYGAQVSKKTVRKLKRKFFWTSLKLKFKSLFSPQQRVSDRTLLIIIAAVAFLVLLIFAWPAALVLALVLLVLYLAGVI